MLNEVVKLKPVIKRYIWGGQYFSKFNKGEGDISELWELSVRKDNSSVIDSGEFKGTPLFDKVTKEDIGPINERFPYFPLLIKLIDAKESLSIQVHPSDEYALKNEGQFGKTEMWYILGNEPGAGLYVGFKKDYSKEEIETALKGGKIVDLLNFFPVKKGDSFVINSGTIHAIGKGVRLIEIQQNSDLTYRLYDYDRVDKSGNKRELHIEKALKVINNHKYEQVKTNSSLLGDTEYFKVEKKELNGNLLLEANQKSFVSFTFIEGNGMVNDINANQYDTFFLPYGKRCEIKGKGTLIVSYIL